MLPTSEICCLLECASHTAGSGESAGSNSAQVNQREVWIDRCWYVVAKPGLNSTLRTAGRVSPVLSATEQRRMAAARTLFYEPLRFKFSHSAFRLERTG